MYDLTIKAGLFFGTDTGNTEYIAEKIAGAFADKSIPVDMENIADIDIGLLKDYDLIVLGIPTWDFGGIQSEWQSIEENLLNLDLSGKYVALYGLGDQFGYGDYFVDALGWLYNNLIGSNADFIGFWPTDEYDFEASKAVIPDTNLFCGLAVDEDDQEDLSESRIYNWVNQIIKEISTSYNRGKDHVN